MIFELVNLVGCIVFVLNVRIWLTMRFYDVLHVRVHFRTVFNSGRKKRGVSVTTKYVSLTAMFVYMCVCL